MSGDVAARVEEVGFKAQDGVRLAGTLYRPEGEAKGRVLVQSAASVPRQYYKHFGRWMMRRGWAVLTFDYRGIGGSAGSAGPAAHVWGMSAWGVLDAPAAWEALRELVSEATGPTVVVGHSVGGQLAGLSDRALEADAWVMVAAQSGYWRHWRGADRVTMWALWHLAIPALGATVGYLPGRLLGGDPMPGAVAREWASWGRHPEYILSHAQDSDIRARFEALGAIPRQVWSFEDDWMAPHAAVDALASWSPGSSRHGERALLDRRRWAHGEYGLARVGHFGFFRPARDGAPGGEVLWEALARWVGEVTSEGSVRAVSHEVGDLGEAHV